MISLVGRLLKKSLLHTRIKDSIILGRGNIKDDFPSDFTAEEKKMIDSVSDYTMTSPERLVGLSRAIDYLIQNGVKGDIVECGVWKGGSMMLMAKKLLEAGSTDRSLYLFDTFEGMSAPDDKDVSVDNQKAEHLLNQSDKFQGTNVWCYSSLKEVQQNINQTNYNRDHIFYIKGKVEDTLPHPSLGNIALLRLDTDWYESTRHELETLYDKLVPGGILIIDDYGHWSGCKQAVDEFFKSRNIPIFLFRMDYTGRIAIKR